MKGLAIEIKKFSKRAPKEFLLTVEWYRKDDTTLKYASMNISQEMVVNTDSFGNEWKQLN